MLLLFIVACNPASADVDPVPVVLSTSLPVMTKEQCIELLQKYYTSEQWKGLSLIRSPFSPWSTGVMVHLGEQACEQELYY